MSMPKKPRPRCLCGCGREVAKATMKFYSNKCQQEYEYQEYVTRWKAGLESGRRGFFGSTSSHIRKYLRKKFGDQCSICSWAEHHPLTGSVPLEVDHINGDATDNGEGNLRLLCPNCHSLTLNFRNLNKGPGRVNRR